MEDGKMKFITHADHPFMDYTLCGMALEGDSVNEFEAAELSDSGITCDNCRRLVKHCKKISL